MLRERIEGPSAWLGPDLRETDGWLVQLDDATIAEIDAAVTRAEELGLSIPFEQGALPVPRTSELLDAVTGRLEDGLGFVLVRGIPRQRYTARQCELIYWLFAVDLGTPISQNTRGHLLGHVRDEGKSFEDPTARGYQTSAKMDFHADQLPVDVLGLFCVQDAKSGGESAIVSVDTVHNVMVEEHPDLLEALYEPFNLDWRGEEPPGESGWYTSPMFSYSGGKVTSRITSRQYFNTVTRFGEHLALTDLQREALDAVQEVCNRPELQLRMRMQPGDMQFLNNHAILHARTAFEDHAEEDLKRHLLRIWIALPSGKRRTLAPELEDRYRIVELGGIPARAAW